MRWEVHKALESSAHVIDEVDREWGKITGRYYGGLVECYRCDDADFLFIGVGAWVGDMRLAVDKLRDVGYRFGALKVRYIRPFPGARILELVKGRKGVVVLDRSISAGSAGPIFLDLAAYLQGKRVTVPIKDVVAGLAGFEVNYEDFVKIGEKFAGEVLELGWVKDYLEFYPSR
jgi:2-oxoisovalerate ferredoxin oxidoreductase alpha subunit